MIAMHLTVNETENTQFIMKHKTTWMTTRAIILVIVLFASFQMKPTSGFLHTRPSIKIYPVVQKRIHQDGASLEDYSTRSVYRSAHIDSSSIVVSTESWRQYVPLVVSVGIIIDILLGNPLANAVLKPMRPEEDTDGSDMEENKVDKPRSKARIDAELVAQQALDKANNTLELRNFLEERKTDYDRMEEMKRKLDATMQDLDEDLEARQKSIDERSTD